MKGIEFVTFHLSVGIGHEVHPNNTLVHTEYLSVIDMLFRSAALVHPDMRAVVLTDEATEFSGVSYPHKKIREKIDPEAMILSRTRAQLRYLKTSNFASPIVFLDSDMLVNCPLTPLFSQDFDVAVTWRHIKKMPLNGGVLIVNNVRPNVVRNFFSRFLDLFETKYAHKAGWYGDQLAIAELIGLTSHECAVNQIVQVGDCRVLLLPCAEYNFSPDNTFKAIESALTDKVILHFKGPRKHLMEHYWRAYLSGSNTYSLWSSLRRLIARQGIRKLVREESRSVREEC